MKANALAKCLFDFESKYSSELQELKVLQFNAWQIVKFPLFFTILSGGDAYSVNHQPVRPFHYKRFLLQLNKLQNFVKLISFFFIATLQRTGSPRPVLFYTSSRDKLVKDTNGKFFNVLTDSFITNDSIQKYVYVEQSFNNEIKQPSAVRIDFRKEWLDSVALFYRIKFTTDLELKNTSVRLLGILNRYVKEEQLTITFSQESIFNSIINFVTEFKVSEKLLGIINPSFMITSERLGTGLQAAANYKNISTIDLQHGIIDKFHPQYIYSPNMKAAKGQMALPSFIGVFGQLHKEILLRKDFWSDSEIIILGSSRMNQNRLKYRKADFDFSNEERCILIPTQYTVVEEILILLGKLEQIKKYNFRIVLKLHPLEHENNIQRYNEFAKLHPGFVQIEPTDSDVYQLIKSSKFVVGFDSAVLLESASLCVPTITIGIPAAPMGVHDFFYDLELIEAIKKFDIHDIDKLIEAIVLSISDPMYYSNWAKSMEEWSERLYAREYLKNCKSLANKILNQY